MSSINYGKTMIHYFQHRQFRKDIKISVDLVNGVVIYAPEMVTDEQIRKTVEQKAKWINEKLLELNEIKTTVQPKEFVSGEKLPYLGRHYRLKVHRIDTDTATIGLKQGKFFADVPKQWSQYTVQVHLEKQIVKWYRHHGYKKLLKRAAYFQHLLGVEPNSIHLRTQHKRWGTCTPEGNIYVNWRIVMAPVPVIDYVIVHELAHLVIPEHNQKFWQTIKSVLPDYEKQKEWLRVHGIELHCINEINEA